MGVFSGSSKLKIFQGGTKVKKAYLGATKIYSSGNIVTYVVDSGVTYSEEVDEGASVLSPASFTPTKSGWEFVGWREDAAASGDVLSGKVMGDEPVTLYAVFGQGVTVSYYHVSNSTKQQSIGTKYYNNGNVVNPRFTISPSGYGSEWTFRGWTTGTVANASVTYTSINNTEFSSDITLYILLQRPVTLSYNGNGASSGSVGSETKYVYLNSYGTNTVSNPTFTLKSNGFGRTNYTFTGWNLGAAGATVTLDSSTTAYAQWVWSVTNYAYNGGVQTYTAPVAGTYQLEVWGAQGGTCENNPGSDRSTGGLGGYSKGNVYLTSGQVIYICVGGEGGYAYGEDTDDDGEIDNEWEVGGKGYNGGGSVGSYTRHFGFGGGATHIAINSNRGELRNYASYQNEILIVAGGGGGAGAWSVSDPYSGHGGSGGGTNGGDGTCGVYQGYAGVGGTQTAGGSNGGALTPGGFGYGGSGSDSEEGAGGGGGWYGGSSAGYYSGAGGGSGYIGGVSSGSMSNGVQSGNGKATVTFISVA